MALTRPRAAQIYNLDYKQATRAVTVANITLAGGAPAVVDGVSLNLNDRVLVTGQNNGAQNGIYYVSTLGSGSNGTWTLASDDNTTGEVDAGMIVMVTEGVIYADTQWKLITDNPIVIGTTALTFTQNYLANAIVAGTSNVSVQSNANVTISSAGTANVLTISSTGTVVKGTESVTGNITAGNILTSGLISLTGNIYTGNILTNGYYYANGVVFGGGGGGTPGGANTQIQYNNNGAFGGSASFTFNNTTNAIATTGAFSATANITGGNILTAGIVSATGNIVTAGNFVGNGAALTGLPAGYTNSNVSTFLAAFGSNTISTTGTVTAGNITGSNILTGGLISATGSITSAANITGGNVLANGSITVTSTTANTVTATLTHGSDNNFQLTAQNGVATNATGTEVARFGIDYITAGWDSFTQYIRGSSSQNGYQTLWASNTQIATINSSGILVAGVASATGNITGGNILTGGIISASGNIATTGNITAGGYITNSTYISTNTLSAVGAVITGNITGGNLLTGGIVSSTGNATHGNLSVSTGTITVGNIVNANGNAVGNIGSSSLYFNTAFIKAATAQYADLAEMYCADDSYPPGTVVEFGGTSEITITTTSHSTAVAGIISTNPSYLMNSTIACEINALEVALVGRVPCQVVGTIRKGDRLVSSKLPGVAQAMNTELYKPGCIIGKALEEYNSADIGTIEVAVGRT